MKQIKMIDNYADLPLGLYLELLRINSDEMLETLDRQAQIIAILTGLSDDEVYRLPLDEYSACAARLAFLEHDVPQPRRPIGKTVTFGGVTYSVPQDPAKITTAQFVDFKAYSKMWTDNTRPLAETLSSMLVPAGHKYGEGYDVKDVQRAILEQMDTITAFALSAFFLTSWSKFIRDSLSYSERLLKRLEKKGKTEEAQALKTKVQNLKATLEQNGPGSTMLWPLRMQPILRGTPFGKWDASNS